jgi:hypothetical protein
MGSRVRRTFRSANMLAGITGWVETRYSLDVF